MSHSGSMANKNAAGLHYTINDDAVQFFCPPTDGEEIKCSPSAGKNKIKRLFFRMGALLHRSVIRKPNRAPPFECLQSPVRRLRADSRTLKTSLYRLPKGEVHRRTAKNSFPK